MNAFRDGRGVKFITYLRLLPRLMHGGYLHSAYTTSWRVYGQLVRPVIPVRRKRAQTAVPRAGYETMNSADESRVFVVAAVLCHSCNAIRTVRQPWTVSLGGYNISRLPHSRARGIEMCARRRGKHRAGCWAKVKHCRHLRVVMTDPDRSRYSLLITALGVGPSLKGSWVPSVQWRTQEFCSVGGVSTNSVEDRGQREQGPGGGSPLVRGSGGSCNLVQEISFHIVKFS